MPAIAIDALESGINDERIRLTSALRGAGAFVVTGHAISNRAIDTMLAAADALFQLPRADLDAIDMVHSPHFRGYSALGSERTGGKPDMREQWDAGRDEPARAFDADDPSWMRLRGPNLWPERLPELQTLVPDWMARMRALGGRVLDQIVAAGMVSRDTLPSATRIEGYEQLKLVRYPPAGTRGDGVGAHTDSGHLALIVQAGAPGLQLDDRTGFRPAVSRRRDIIVIAGRAVHHATGGLVYAAPHRVIASGRAIRTSVTYFVNPPLEEGDYGAEALRVAMRSHPRAAEHVFSPPVSAAAANTRSRSIDESLHR